MSERPVAKWLGVSIALVLVVATFKAVVGESITTSPLYVLPAVACCWHAGRLPAVAVAATSALAYPLVHAWVLVDGTTMQVLANTAVIAVATAAAIGLVHRFRRDYDHRAEAEQVLQAVVAQRRAVRGSHLLCPHCHRIRDEVGAWEPLERWLSQKTSATFAHAGCPMCTRDQR